MLLPAQCFTTIFALEVGRRGNASTIQCPKITVQKEFPISIEIQVKSNVDQLHFLLTRFPYTVY
jgi:hypothetical protein